MALSEQEIIRREKLQSLRNLGINPYPANLFPVNHTSKQIKAKSFTYAQDASKPKSFEKHFFIEQQQLLLSEKKMTRHISHP